MNVYRLGHYKRAYLWLNDLAEIQYSVQAEHQHLFAAPESRINSTISVAIEIYWPVGPRIMRGLLGATFVPEVIGHLALRIALLTDGQDTPQSEAVGTGSSLHPGLPAEYADSVLKGVIHADAYDRLGQGTLLVNRAAFHHAGSSGFIFSRLASSVVRVMACGSDPDDTEIQSILATEFSQ